ncbi:MAG: phosphate regulon sensor histidine kinase PhoR [Burkholderiales bacterium]|jgi:two-component system phosphate regulon sensor histidine kinase PhoR|nr:phosphate regulon sensor histidine kinase PhoR [Burkholderiales bacterium]
MVWRALFLLMLTGLCFCFAQSSGALNTYTASVIACLFLVLLALFILDRVLGLRLIEWLKRLQENPMSPIPRFSGAWRETAERVTRLLKQKDHALHVCQTELDNFYAALEASPDGLIILDEQMRILWCNQSACGHFGLDAARDQDQSVTHLLRDPVLVNYLSAKTYQQPVIIESPKSIHAQPLRLSVQLYAYGEGRLLMQSRDVTAILQAEAMRRDFVANVSHEIRTPLTVLSGFVETLQTLPLTDHERDDYLLRMANQAHRMKHLVDDLLTLSRIESNAPPDLKTWVSARMLLQQCETDARALSALVLGDHPPHSFIFPKDETVNEEIAGNAHELQSAFFNLINNAVRYTPAGGTIEVQWEKLPGGQARFLVKDTGQGVAPEHIPRLTERFYRVDSDRSRATGGTGLGLSIVKHVAQRHDATLTIESVVGQGSTFAMTLPAQRIDSPKREFAHK